MVRDMETSTSPVDITGALSALDAPLREGHLINLLNGVRREALFCRVAHAAAGPHEGLRELLEQHQDQLVNPLLMPSLVALALHGIGDGRRLLEAFVRGDAMIGLEERLAPISVGSFDVAGAAAFLDTEERYLEGLCALVLDRVFDRHFVHGVRHHPAVGLAAFGSNSRAGAQAFKSATGVSAHDLRFEAWYVFNPILSFPWKSKLGAKERAAILFLYAHRRNSFWHNHTERCEHDFEAVKKRLNEDPTSPGLADAYGLAERLLSRSQRFYWWNPMEAHAHLGEEFAKEAYLKAAAKEGGGR